MWRKCQQLIQELWKIHTAKDFGQMPGRWLEVRRKKERGQTWGHFVKTFHERASFFGSNSDRRLIPLSSQLGQFNGETLSADHGEHHRNYLWFRALPYKSG